MLKKEATEKFEVDDLKNPDFDENEEDEELLAEYPTAGVRERTLLCPIQEEDTESTASGSSVSIRNKVANDKQSVISTEEKSNPSSNTTDVTQEEVRDGHYFIKVINCF